MKLEDKNTQTPVQPPTEIGYPMEAFRKMITDARESGYSQVTAKDIKSRARKRNGLSPK